LLSGCPTLQLSLLLNCQNNRAGIDIRRGNIALVSFQEFEKGPFIGNVFVDGFPDNPCHRDLFAFGQILDRFVQFGWKTYGDTRHRCFPNPGLARSWHAVPHRLHRGTPQRCRTQAELAGKATGLKTVAPKPLSQVALAYR
ncbi:MAG TPA: hypothetical protein VFE56_03690, partial [Candidatus Binataceae bacterium]|nr:hypothetical protein [Candidatus Binataceae bacterium]